MGVCLSIPTRPRGGGVSEKGSVQYILQCTNQIEKRSRQDVPVGNQDASLQTPSITLPPRLDIKDLSCDLLSIVFSHLPSHDVSNVRLVCKLWCEAVRAGGRLRPVQVKWYMLRRKFCDVTHLDLSMCAQQLYDNMLRYLPSLPRLKTLDLTGAVRLTGEDFQCLASLSGLEVLSLKGCRKIRDEGFLCLENMVSLTSLDISNCRLLSANSLQLVLPSLPALIGVTLDDVLGVDDDVLQGMQESSAGKLERVSLCFDTYYPGTTLKGNEGITDSGMKALSQLPLTSLKLAGCPRITLTGLTYLSNMTSLRHLDITSVQSVDISDTGFLTLRSLETLLCQGHFWWLPSDLNALTELPSLTTLYLGSLSVQGATSLEPINSLRRLSTLTLSISFPDRFSCFDILVPPNLRELNLYVSGAVQMDALASGSFTQLTKLCIQSLCHLTPAFVSAIGTASQLQHLDFIIAEDTAKGSPDFAPLSSLTNLEYLAVNTCVGADTSLLEACANLHNLCCLQLRLNTSAWRQPAGQNTKLKLTDDLVNGLAKLMRLHHLEIGESSTLTKRGLRAVASLPNLRTLILQGGLAASIDQALACLSPLTGLRELVVKGGGISVNTKTLDALRPFTWLRYVCVTDPYAPFERRSFTLQTLFNPSRADATQLSENTLVAFLDSHPVLQDYEFISGCPNGNAKLFVRRSGGNVSVMHA